LYIVFLFFWAIAFFILMNESRTTADTWVAISIIFFGFGGLSAFLQELPVKNQDLWFWPAAAASISMIWGSYGLLIYSFHNIGIMPKSKIKQRIIEFLYAIPLICFYFIIPAIEMFGLRETASLQILHTKVMTAFVTPYFLGAAIILTINLFRKNSSIRRTETITSYILIVPATLMYYLTSFLIPCFGYPDMWRINIVTISLESILFLVLVIKKSVFGLFFSQRNATREQMEKAIIEGTGVLQHAMKNNLLTVRLALQNAIFRYSQNTNDTAAIMKNIQLALDSCEHSLSILERIHLKIHPVRLRLKTCTLLPIIEQVIDQSQTEYDDKVIQIVREFSSNPQLHCDPVHLREVLLNLVNNAMEAMGECESGQLIISVIEGPKKVVIQIKDNGCGIEKTQIKKLGIPLNTAKVKGTHYGLGLYYVKKVIGMHNGQFSLRKSSSGGMIAQIVLMTIREKNVN